MNRTSILSNVLLYFNLMHLVKTTTDEWCSPLTCRIAEVASVSHAEFTENQARRKAELLDRSRTSLHPDVIDIVGLGRWLKRHVTFRHFFGICFGTISGREQHYFKKVLGWRNGSVIGTDIPPVASGYPDTVLWDFHIPKDEWLGKADFVYSNALDHSHDPRLALQQWLRTIDVGGVLLLEHCSAHMSYRPPTKIFAASFSDYLRLIMSLDGVEVVEVLAASGKQGQRRGCRHIVAVHQFSHLQILTNELGSPAKTRLQDSQMWVLHHDKRFLATIRAASSLDEQKVAGILQLPRPASHSFDPAYVAAVMQENHTLLEYLVPLKPVRGDIHKNWQPQINCKMSKTCYCFLHFKGSMDKIRNPNGIHQCMIRSLTLTDCAQDPYWGPQIRNKNCSCLISQDMSPHAGCLFSDMRPLKLLAIISLARKLGITHIIEEGRYGGLSALVYAIHGFNTTSVEWVPLDDVTTALQALAPSVRLLNGDGAKIIPQELKRMSHENVAVIFDGEKRSIAYRTFKKIRSQVKMAVFDDAFARLQENFVQSHLDRYKEKYWTTKDFDKALLERERYVLETLSDTFGSDMVGNPRNMDEHHMAVVFV